MTHNNLHTPNTNPKKCIPKRNKLQKSIKIFQKQASPLTEEGVLAKSVVESWQKELEKIEHKHEESSFVREWQGRRKHLVHMQDLLAECQQNANNATSVIRSLPDVARKLSILLNSIDKQSSERTKENRESSSLVIPRFSGRVLPESITGELAPWDSTLPIPLNTSFNRELNPTDFGPQSPRTCLQELLHPTAQRENKKESKLVNTKCDNFGTIVDFPPKDKVTRTSLDEAYKNVVDRLAKTDQNKVREGVRVLDLKDVTNKEENASNVTITKFRTKPVNERFEASPPKPSGSSRANIRTRRPSAYVIPSGFAPRHMDSDWEGGITRASTSKKLRIMYLIYKFVNYLIDDMQQRHGLSFSTPDNRLRLQSRIGEGCCVTCPLLQAALQSVVHLAIPARSTGDQVLQLGQVVYNSTQIPLHLASLRIICKGSSNKPAVELKGPSKPANQTSGKTILRLTGSAARPNFAHEADSRNTTDCVRPFACVVGSNVDPYTRFVMVKSKLKPMLMKVTANIIQDYDFETVRKYKLITMLTNMIRDRCRDMLRINHSCDQSLCRRDWSEAMLRATANWERLRDTASYSVIVQTYVLEKNAESAMIASQCLQEARQDCLISYNYESSHIVVTVVVYFIRKYVFFRNEMPKYINNSTLNNLYKCWLDDRVSWINREPTIDD